MTIQFYKETNFKETPIGEIPKDWKVVRLAEIAKDFYYGITARATANKTKLRMLRTTDIKNYCVNWDDLPFCEITEKRRNMTKYLLMKDDIIIARAGTTGVSVLVDKKLDNVIFGSYLIKVRLKNNAYPKFMHYFLQSHLYWKHITSSQAGSTLKNISLPVLKSLKIPLPTIQEQQKIAEILSTVDEAIHKTNEIIAKAKRLKKGLMQELLTKGIGHKEFKDTEIGRIPKEWEVVKLGNALELCQYGLSIPMSDKGKYPIIRMDEIVNGYVIPKISKFVDLDEKTFKTFKLEKGDILFNRTNAYELVGRTGIFLLNGNYVFASYLIRLRPKREIFDPHFLTYYLIFSHNRLKQLATKAVHQANINARNLKKVKIPKPSLVEQQKIASILSTIDKKLEIERKEKEKLERIKQGLMDLLLTGKIRVKVN
ncbi:MAG TPA: restriction endonuclease subunit S [Thermococcus sp.]|nr:restriction endonuclease subunit S [Thermococcus sp.]